MHSLLAVSQNPTTSQQCLDTTLLGGSKLAGTNTCHLGMFVGLAFTGFHTGVQPHVLMRLGLLLTNVRTLLSHSHLAMVCGIA